MTKDDERRMEELADIAESAASAADDAADEARELARRIRGTAVDEPPPLIPNCLRDLLRDPSDRLALARARDWLADLDWQPAYDESPRRLRVVR